MRRALITPVLKTLIVVLAWPISLIGMQDAQAQEEDQLLFGSQEHLSGLVDELSAANKALYVENHLENIDRPTQIYYDFEKDSRLEDDIEGRVVVNIIKLRPSGRKDMTFRFLKGRNKVRFPPQVNMEGNPVFMLFLERDAREMQRYTGGNALYFRNRIRHALAAADTKPARFDFQGREVEGREIRIQPFATDELADRFPRYRDKEYRFLLSTEVPGMIYQIDALTPSQSGEDWVSQERLTFRSLAADLN